MAEASFWKRMVTALSSGTSLREHLRLASSGSSQYPAQTEARLRVTRIIQMIGSALPEKVLLVGEAEGMLAKRLRKQGAGVTWFETGAGGTAKGVSPLQAEGIKRLIGNPEKLPFEDEEFDLAVSQLTMEHVRDPALVAAELVRVIRRGGSIILVTHNGPFQTPAGRPGPKPLRDFEPRNLCGLMQPLGLKEIETSTLLPDLIFAGLYRRDLSFCLRLGEMPYINKRGRLLYLKGVKG